MELFEMSEYFGQQLKALMKRERLTDVEVAQNIGVTYDTVRKMANGNLPSLRTLHKIAVFFDVDIGTLLEEKKQPTKEEIFERDIEGYMRLTGRSRKAALWDRQLIKWKKRD